MGKIIIRVLSFWWVFVIGFLIYVGLSLPDRIKAWYPIEKTSMECKNKTYTVFLMSHTIGWSSVPYLIEVDTGRAIHVNESCTYITLEKYIKWNGDMSKDTRSKTQRNNTIYGGISR